MSCYTDKLTEGALSLEWQVIFLCLFSRGLSPEEADLQYLKVAAAKLVMFGVDAHPARVGGNFFMILF